MIACKYSEIRIIGIAAFPFCWIEIDFCYGYVFVRFYKKNTGHEAFAARIDALFLLCQAGVIPCSWSRVRPKSLSLYFCILPLPVRGYSLMKKTYFGILWREIFPLQKSFTSASSSVSPSFRIINAPTSSPYFREGTAATCTSLI